ncbi:Integral peroxisomal membrane peroxin [Teratosphaeria destructans]|uniref:Integral peroxisomal membrane peroxin n=1 Tax=Teratosphaeria destructans TaxID=418781 RepID=A0A9W7VZ95_9PEZI|nr:Integral peroxisomal membrane peroxin [Teratosphaeria destructans]
MDDASYATIANRDEPIPVLKIPVHEDGDDAYTTPEASEVEQKSDFNGSDDGEGRPGFRDKLFAGIMSQILPSEEMSEHDPDATTGRQAKPKDRRSRKYVERPTFSIPVMSANFRRFNARVGVLFVMQNRMIHLFTWKHPTATLSFLAIYSLIALQPSLLPTLPLLALLFWIMIPSFMARHPAPANDPRVEPSFRGPPVAPPSRVKPAPEMSKDFFRNMRDLQNCMEDFSRLHDAANEYITPYTNFSDEAVSSLLFVSAFTVACLAFVGSHLVPWRAVALVAGWTMTLAGHPEAQKVMLSSINLSQTRHHLEGLQHWLQHILYTDIVLDEPPEVRQVEIFELQKQHASTGTWEAWLFSPSPYDPLSPARISGSRAKGTQFFEDVEPPAGWKWKDKKWNLDLWSSEWVEQRMISGVEVETEGERWVYDLPEEILEGFTAKSKGKTVKGKERAMPKSGWEEGTGREERGGWRRRRWIRLVERKSM